MRIGDFGLRIGRHLIRGRGGIQWIFGGGDEVVAKEGGGFVGGDAHVFLVENFLVTAFDSFVVEVLGFVHLLDVMVVREGALDFVEAAFVEEVLEGVFVVAEAARVGVVFDLHHEAMELGVGAAWGGKDFDVAAPVGAGHGDGEEFFLLFVEGEFVEDAVAAFAGLSVGIGGEGVDAVAVGEVDAVLGDGFDEAIAEAAELEEVGAPNDVFDEKASLGLVGAAHPGVDVARAVTEVEGVAEHGEFGPAELAAFDAKFARGIVKDPLGLCGKEVAGGADFGFADEVGGGQHCLFGEEGCECV